jgi:hypothetical protein
MIQGGGHRRPIQISPEKRRDLADNSQEIVKRCNKNTNDPHPMSIIAASFVHHYT